MDLSNGFRKGWNENLKKKLFISKIALKVSKVKKTKKVR